MKIIESVTIRYFRSVYTLQLPDCEDMTVLTGRNDVGKSNILKALNLFFCQQSDYLHFFDFSEDYSLMRKEEVRRDTIRGQQFISITVRFIRGDRMPNSLPPKFSVTKRWDMHSSEYKMETDVHQRMEQYAKKMGISYSEKTTQTFLSTFLNKIKFIYIPAIKDERVFNETLNILQQSLFASKNQRLLDEPIGRANEAIQSIIGVLQHDFEMATGIRNFVELPNTLNYTNGLLQVNTQVPGGSVTIDKRGDGIRTHYIPKILNYVATQSKDLYIWGFEEPENSYEYRRCIQVAEEFENEYSEYSQIFITSHSPAFFKEQVAKKKIYRIGKEDGKTVLLDNSSALDEELGYIELYKDFIEKVKELEKKNAIQVDEISNLRTRISEIQTPFLLTEGKTDTDLMKLAIEKLRVEKYQDWKIQPAREDDTVNNTALLDFLKGLRDNIIPTKPIIGMFDRDTKLEVKIDGGKVDIRDRKFVKLSPNVYAFAIPVPYNRLETNQISIEHYFSDQEIMTELEGKRLYLANEFFSTGVHKQNPQLCYKISPNETNTIKIIEHSTSKYVMGINGEGDYSISKARFVEAIKEKKEGFDSISFAEFRRIFDVIDEIIADAQS